MNELHDKLPVGDDPEKILGVSSEANDEDIRQAYLRKVKESPPDRCPQEFERIRDAYELLRDPIRRTTRMLLSTNPKAPLVSLLQDYVPERRFVGEKLWLAVLKER